MEDSTAAVKKIVKNHPTQQPYAELASLLATVRLAWRNEVMHPKGIYTAEEAESVLQSCKAYMLKLAEVLPMPAPAMSLPAIGPATPTITAVAQTPAGAIANLKPGSV